MTGREFRLKRVSLPADAADGGRVLVDRLWPRGISRERAQIDLWCRGLAPSAHCGGACTAKAWAPAAICRPRRSGRANWKPCHFAYGRVSIAEYTGWQSECAISTCFQR